jgi:hypothetical protein
LCDAGFQILHFVEHGESDKSAEPGTKAHAYSYAPPFLCIYARKPLLLQEELPHEHRVDSR